LLVRGAKPGTAEGLQKIVETNPNVGARVAAIYTLKQLLGAKSTPMLVAWTKNDDLREHALRALSDDVRIAAQIPAQPFIDALNDKNPKVRLQAVTGLGHLGKIEAAEQLLAHTADSDYTVAHIAVRALGWLKASDVCMHALDSADAKVQPGALRVLQGIYEPAVVDGLLKRLATAQNPELHRGIYKALCRLNFKEATYTDPKMWWGTRPDTSGPIYKPETWDATEKIQSALKQQLDAAQGEDAKTFVTALMRNKITFPGLTDLMLAKVGKDTASRLDVIQPLLSPKAPVAEDVVKALSAIATSPNEQPELRARALRMLTSIVEKNFNAVRDAMLPLAAAQQQGPLAEVWEEFTRDTRLSKKAGDFAALARDKDSAKRNLGATVLVNIITSTVIKDKKAKDAAQKAVDDLWKNPEQAATLLSVIGKTHATQFGPQVREQLNNPSHVVAEAAEFALTKLGLDKTGAPSAKTIGEMKYEDVVKIAVAAANFFSSRAASSATRFPKRNRRKARCLAASRHVTRARSCASRS
jgi:HEAT repeat protein